MPTVFTHAYFALTLRAFYPRDPEPVRLAVLGALCAAAPDLDAIGYWCGVPYDHPCGHRGLTHSVTFAVVLGVLVALLAFRDVPWRSQIAYGRMRYLTMATVSHGALDMCTHGGRGVAFLAPFVDTRYALPWQPLQAAPLSPAQFFTADGLAILAAEMLWIWAPMTALALLVLALRRARRNLS